MKYLIVNGDDFGASHGINRGIMEAHRRGILTSASLLVNAVASEEAARLSRAAPKLSVGLHVDLGGEPGSPVTDSSRRLRRRLRDQFSRFENLMGCPPTHLDARQNTQRDPQALPCLLDLAQEYGLPLREHSAVRYYPEFHGQSASPGPPKQINAKNLARLLKTDIGDGITELSCHPGYVDAGFATSDASAREAELRALCDVRVRRAVSEKSIQLINYRKLGMLLVSLSATEAR
jgi:chitin disaccharide deacetylase